MYQILQKFDIHWHDGGPSIAMMYHLRRVSDLLCNWKSCLLCYMKDVVLHCSIFFKWNKLVRVRVRVRVRIMWKVCSCHQVIMWCKDAYIEEMAINSYTNRIVDCDLVWFWWYSTIFRGVWFRSIESILVCEYSSHCSQLHVFTFLAPALLTFTNRPLK